jgi:uncharacterized protein (DUF362 family)/NAD-dependent dihydropyrimidine dehydrogenase PreA subunit
MKSKVVLVRCDSYDEEKVYKSLRAGLDCLGGLKTFVKPDEKVLLKLNLVRDAAVERAVTVHPTFAVQLARIFSEDGYAHVKVGDSPGIGNGQAVMNNTGMIEGFKKYGVEPALFDKAVHVDYPEGIHAKEFMMAQDVLDADALISVSKMKTHALEHLTGAVKNQYGCIQGANKAKGHTKYPSAESMARMLIDLNRFVKPRLFIMDGIMAMEGNGPTSGDPTPMNTILISTDPVALDSVFAALVHVDPEIVPTETAGEMMGLGTYKWENIEVIAVDPEKTAASLESPIDNTKSASGVMESPADGTVSASSASAAAEETKAPCAVTMTPQQAAEKYGNPDFNVIRGREKVHGWMGWVTNLRVFSPKPHIDASRCVKCGVCVQSCPVEGKALHFSNGRKNPPVYNYRKCIRCFCCQEMCPHKAIYTK